MGDGVSDDLSACATRGVFRVIWRGVPVHGKLDNIYLNVVQNFGHLVCVLPRGGASNPLCGQESV